MSEHETLAAALAAFQAELPVIVKDNVANVKTKNGQVFTYSYADLSDISPVVLRLLGKHGLAWTTRPTLTDGGSFVLEYALLHAGSSEVVKGRYPLPNPNMPAQEMGTSISYARRYALLSVTGVAPGDDAPPEAEDAAPEQPVPDDWEAQIEAVDSREGGSSLWARASAEGWLTTEVKARITEQVKKVTENA